MVLCLDRGGLVGADGPTHHGAYDIAYFRCIPNMVVSAPMDEEDLRNLMYTAQLPDQGPFSIRYPRGAGIMPEWKTPMKEIPIGKGRMIQDGDDLAILSFGAIGFAAKDACKELRSSNISMAHYDMRFAKPLDKELLTEIFKKHNKVITLEDGCLQGGFGSAILEWMSENGVQAEVKRLGIPDKFIEHGTQAELYKECGYHTDDIVKLATEMVGIKQKAIAG